MNNLLGSELFGCVGGDLCRLAANGNIAVKTSNGYKVYEPKTGRLTNCANFVFNIGNEFCFVVPCKKVEAGDIIIVDGKPRCVVSGLKDGTVRVVNYETNTMEDLLPERHMILGGATYFKKLVSPFKKGTGFNIKSIMKMQALSALLGNKSAADANSAFFGTGSGNQPGGNNQLMLLMMMNGGGDMFDGMFDMFDGNGLDLFGDDEDSEEKEKK